MHQPHVRLLVTAAVLGLACDAQSPTATAEIQASVTAGDPKCTDTYVTARSDVRDFVGRFPCLSQVEVLLSSANQSQAQSYSGVISTAMLRWNNNFPSGYELPRFKTPPVNTSGTSGSIVVFAYPVQNGGGWCGVTSGSSIRLYQQPSGSTDCPQVVGGLVVPMVDVATHELGHRLGFSGDHLPNTGPTASCVMAVPEEEPMNTMFCHHERQLVYWVYGLRNSKPDLEAVMTNPVPLISPTSVTVRPESLASFTASEDVTWSINNTSIASLLSSTTTSATLRGVAEGSTTLTGTGIATPTVIWPTQSSNPATITVARPPAATVTIDPATVDLVGPTDVTLIATVTDVDGVVRPDIQLTWTVSDTSRVYFVPSGQSAWVSAKRNGWVTITATAPNGVLGTATVYIEGCKIRCLA